MKLKEVLGLIHTPKGIAPKTITVRYTDDKNGKSLSFADDSGGIMIQIPFEAIENWFKYNHKRKK